MKKKKTSKGKRRSGRLFRSDDERIIGGVCGGIAKHVNTDPTIIRLIWVVGTLVWGFGILAYLLAWIIIPEKN
jgi:phage shock protein C